MSDRELLRHVSINPKIMTGKPVIAGTRVTVETILNQLAHGASKAEIISDFPGLTETDIRASLLFASQSIAKLPLLVVTAEPV